MITPAARRLDDNPRLDNNQEVRQTRRPRVLLIVEQCNPEWPSVPLEGFRYYSALRHLAEVTLVTHERNRPALTKAGATGQIAFIRESSAARQLDRLAGRLTGRRGRINWPLRHALTYPVYAEFDSRVFRRFGDAVGRGEYDVVHAFTPILPRYPVKMIEACRRTPFVLGPVNGGLKFPSGFEDVGRQEFDRYSFLRGFARYLPGYRRTYQRASRILAGSRATYSDLRNRFSASAERVHLLHENGVPCEFFAAPVRSRKGGAIRLLFVGRLVPYKCADVVIEAMSRLDTAIRNRTSLIIVGDGPERENLERLAGRLHLGGQVRFTGWVPQERTLEFYQQSDIFCFPSVREFGGAVVLEAMAAGLACIVADYGGIAEYVTEETGFKIPVQSREYLAAEMARCLGELEADRDRLAVLSAKAVERAREFTWENKARRTVEIYEGLIAEGPR